MKWETQVEKLLVEHERAKKRLGQLAAQEISIQEEKKRAFHDMNLALIKAKRIKEKHGDNSLILSSS